MGSSCPQSLVITAWAWVSSCFRVIVSILDDAQRSCLTCCSSPDTNTHVIQCSGSGSPTSWARQCKSAKNLSTVSFCHNCHTINWLNASVMYAVIRALFISSGSTLFSLLGCWYMARAPPRRHSSKTCLILFIVQSLLTSSTFSIHLTIGMSVMVPLNSGISRISNALPVIAKEWWVTK